MLKTDQAFPENVFIILKWHAKGKWWSNALWLKSHAPQRGTISVAKLHVVRKTNPPTAASVNDIPLVDPMLPKGTGNSWQAGPEMNRACLIEMIHGQLELLLQ